MHTITADRRSLIINGQRELIISGAVHYPRSTPAMWPRIMRESKRAGLNCIETYVFWEGHEPEEGLYDFTGRLDLGHFLDVCRDEGLYAILRIGPYICAEWNFGGLPWWLATKTGLVSRTYNKPFMQAMGRFVHVLLDQVGDRQFTQGGPIILAQMENEYNNVSKRYGEEGQRYLAWAAEVGRQAGLEVPLVMCYGASDDVIETLNGFTVWGGVEPLLKERPFQPAIWTENWPGWYDVWGQPHHLRRTSELAYEVTRFFAAGGSGVNYYMWQGGTNFGRDAMYLATTSYDFNAPLDEYGLPTQKSEQMALLHRFLRDHAEILLEGERGEKQVLVPGVQDAASTVQVEDDRLEGGRGDRPVQSDEEKIDESNGVVLYPVSHQGQEIIFVVNATYTAQRMALHGMSEELPARSALALTGSAGAYRVTYRSWAEPEQPITRQMLPAGVPITWSMLEEPLPGQSADADRRFLPVTLPDNMLRLTRDMTDFGWYRTTIDSTAASTAILTAGVADFLAVWVNGQYIGVVPETLKEDRPKADDFRVALDIPLQAGRNELLLLVVALGMVKGDWMLDAPMSQERKGIIAPVLLDGMEVCCLWEFSAGAWGERVKLPDPGPATLAAWQPLTTGTQPLRWYRATFTLTDAERADVRPWAVEIGDLFKGTLWVNGHGLGRYWQQPSPATTTGDEWGRDQFIVVEGAGQPPQRYYHIPADWLQTGDNTLIILEERGAQPGDCQLVRRQ